METIRKDRFVEQIKKSENPKIIQKWEFCASRDGIDIRDEKFTKEQFLNFLSFANNHGYRIMRVIRVDGKYKVFDRTGGSIYSFEVEL